MDDANRWNKLSYVTLWAVRFDDVVRFYRELLELPVLYENESFIMFDIPGARLAFHRLPEAPPLDRRTVEIHLDVEDVDRAYGSLKAKGVRFEHKPVNRPWELRQAAFQDPEGYLVELVGPVKEGEPVVQEGEEQPDG